VEEFLSLDDTNAQMKFWRRRLDTRAFRVLVGAMLSGAGIRSSYSSPLHEVLPAHFDRVMRARMERCWRTHSNRTNFFARKLLLGEVARTMPAGSHRPIDFICADAAEYLASCPPASFDAFTISNILDGTSANYRQRLFEAVRRVAAPGAVLVQRSFREPAAGSPDARENLAAGDRSFIWGIVQATPVERIP
jgi:S-adenosylmethionine:diacylglycerol 3-amino-3-carboxypropyl transferase